MHVTCIVVGMSTVLPKPLTDQHHGIDSSLAEAVGQIRFALQNLENVCHLADQEVCSALVGAEPQLREVYDQLRSAHRDFQSRLKAPRLPNPPLSELAAKMFRALQQLTKEREAHPCGGFTTDDMQWRMGTAFTPAETLHEALDELETAGLIRCAGEDENDAIGICYELTIAP